VKNNTFIKTIIILSIICLLSGCAAQKAFKNGQQARLSENWDEAVAYFTRALALDPTNDEYRRMLDRARFRAAQVHILRGNKYFMGGKLELAIMEYQTACTLDPSNQFAFDELNRIITKYNKAKEEAAAKEDTLDKLKEESEGQLEDASFLMPASDIPIKLNFKETSILKIYNALSKLSGINILFDSTLRDINYSIDVSDVTFNEVLEMMTVANSHFVKVINENTIMIIPDTPTKRRQYEEQVVKTFYLSNADIQQVQQIVKSVIASRNMSTNEALNAIIVKDTPAKVYAVEKIVKAIDKAPAEVVVDVEILEVSRRKMLQYGTALSSYSVTQSLIDAAGESVAGVRATDLFDINRSNWFITIPSITYKLFKSQARGKTIARPQLRATEGQEVELQIGDQVPIPQVTFSQGVNQTNPITNYTYRDIGITVKLKPRVHHNREVTLKLSFTLTTIVSPATEGGVPPTFGNRTVTTSIRLKDGETSLLAGLLREEERSAMTGLPGVMDVPILGKIFSANDSEAAQTDIVLTLTPHIVRLPNITKEDLTPFWVGSEAEFRLTRGGSILERGGALPFDETLPGEEEQQQFLGRSFSPEDMGIVFDEEEGAAGELEGTGDTSRDQSDSTGSQGGENIPTAVITLDPSSGTQAAGDDFTVNILIQSAQHVGHVPFYLSYDPEVLKAVSCSEGTFMSADGTATTFLSDITGPGEIIVGLSRLGRETGANGSGILATVLFRATSPGQSALLFSNAHVKDPLNGTLPSNFVDGSVSVQAGE